MGSAEVPDRPRLVVGMPTFRRPEQLARAIPPVLEQLEQLATLDGAEGRLVVVDNDPQAGAREVVGRFADVHYVHEPAPGISAARNRAIDEAGAADAIVFIDDDETPDPGWLTGLVAGWRQWACAGVTGPVTSVLESHADDWITATRVFARAERVTGSVNPGASSANLLLDLRVLRRWGIRFDEGFGLSGGSDTMLAHTLRSRGEVIRWCQEAGVTEHVPPSRVDRRWVVARTVRTSNTWSRVGMAIAREQGAVASRRMEYSSRGAVRIGRGLVQRAWGLARRDPSTDARGAIDLASGLGILLGTYGFVRHEYQRDRVRWTRERVTTGA